MDEINNKIDKDERFKLAAIGDAGTNKVLFVGDSNSSNGVNFYSKEQTDDLLENKVDKDKNGNFNLAALADAEGYKIILVDEPSNPTPKGVSFYSKAQIDTKISNTETALNNKVDKIRDFYLASPMTEHDTVTGKDKPAILFSDGETDEAITIPAYTSDLENDSGFVTSEQMNEAISGMQGGTVDAYTKTETDELLDGKVDKDERFKLAYVGDTGKSKVLMVGNSNGSNGVNFYSKEQVDALVANAGEKKKRYVFENCNIPFGETGEFELDSSGMSSDELCNAADEILLRHTTDDVLTEYILPHVSSNLPYNGAYYSTFVNDTTFIWVNQDIVSAGGFTGGVVALGGNNDVDAKIGEIETALDSIIAIQNELIGGGTV